MVEAIRSALALLPQQSVALRFLLAASGDLSVSDVDLAAASGGLVLAFNMEVGWDREGRSPGVSPCVAALASTSGSRAELFRAQPDDAVLTHAKQLGVSVKSYRIIYELIDDVKAAMEGKLKLIEERVVQVQGRCRFLCSRNGLWECKSDMCTTA